MIQGDSMGIQAASMGIQAVSTGDLVILGGGGQAAVVADDARLQPSPPDGHC